MTSEIAPDSERSVAQTVRRQAVVPAHLAGRRVDQVAAELFDDFSRANLSAWILAGSLTVDGQSMKPKTRLHGGERLSLDAIIPTREDWNAAQPVSFEIIHEDEAVLVVHKPAGLVVHPGAGNPDQTLVNGLLAHRSDLRRVPRAGVVHRLDKDTSGLLLIAANLTAHQSLVRALAARSVERRYLAICEGRLVSGRVIDGPRDCTSHVASIAVSAVMLRTSSAITLRSWMVQLTRRERTGAGSRRDRDLLMESSSGSRPFRRTIPP